MMAISDQSMTSSRTTPKTFPSPVKHGTRNSESAFCMEMFQTAMCYLKAQKYIDATLYIFRAAIVEVEH